MLWFGLSGCDRIVPQSEDLLLARSAYAEGRYSEAERLYERYIGSQPSGRARWEAWNRLLDIAQTVKGDPERTAEVLDAMLVEYGDNLERLEYILPRLAGVNESIRRYDKALDAWSKLLSIKQLDQAKIPEIRRSMGRLYLAKREFDKALTAYADCRREAKPLELKNQCAYESAQALYFKKDYAGSQKAALELLSTPGLGDEKRALATFLLAELKERDNKKQEAGQLLESIRDIYPNPKVVETRLEQMRKNK